MTLIEGIIFYYSLFMFLYFFVVNIFYVGLILLSLGRLNDFIKVIKSDLTAPTNYTKPVSIIVPAYNEQETVIDNLDSLLALEYPLFEVILVNDGSRDDTLQKVIDHYQLRKIDIELDIKIQCKNISAVYSSFELPQLVVVNKENGGKSDALNAGINVARYPLFCAIDADSVLEKDALFRLVKPFLKNDQTIAVGGIVRIANGSTIENGRLVKAGLPRKFIERFQIIEYLRAFLTSRVGWERLNSLLIISGAFGLFRKASVIEAGGYKNTIGEDMELTLRMHKHFREKGIPYKIDFMSDAVCWTQAPDNYKNLRTQRIRWHRGLIDSLFRNRKMLLHPSYGKVGILAMPYFWFIEMMGPLFEMIGYVIILISALLGLLSSFFIKIFIMAYLFGIFFSLCAIFFEQISYKRYSRLKEVVMLVWVAFLEQLFYRQLTVFWRFAAFINYKKGSKKWGHIKRKTFKEGVGA